MIQRSFTTQSLYTVNFQIYFKLSAFSSSYRQVNVLILGHSFVTNSRRLCENPEKPHEWEDPGNARGKVSIQMHGYPGGRVKTLITQLRMAYLSIILHMWLYRSLQVFQRSNSQVGHRVLSDFTLQMSDQIVRQNVRPNCPTKSSQVGVRVSTLQIVKL